MASPSGARAEDALRRRHREQWPKNAYSYDRDELQVATGRKLVIEVPGGVAAVAGEYKAVDEGPLDLNDLQFRAVLAPWSTGCQRMRSSSPP